MITRILSAVLLTVIYAQGVEGRGPCAPRNLFGCHFEPKPILDTRNELRDDARRWLATLPQPQRNQGPQDKKAKTPGIELIDFVGEQDVAVPLLSNTQTLKC